MAYDKITIINASHWQCADEGETLYYFIGHPVPVGQPCHEVYRPFAWVRINKKSHQMVAARDHFGQEPFYYAFQHEHFIFGSTIPDILSHLTHTPKLTSHFIRDCFMRTPVDDPLDDPPYSNETYYEGVFRVTPAHYLYVNGMEKFETSFWTLDPKQPSLQYTNEHDYLEHFSALLDEAIRATTSQTSPMALEFSGGIDSTAILVACRKASLTPGLFTHVPPITRKPTEEDRNVANLIKQFNASHRHYSVDADNFDPITVFQQFAKIFAGPPPNMNCVLSNNLHRAVIEQGYTALLSGFGGDDCVSLLYPVEIHQWIGRNDTYSLAREYEYDILQGKRCHEMRMRLEYSAVTAKAMGLTYIYPLLYPPLIEFCFSLPFEQKFKQGKMRCTIRDYLSQHVTGMNFCTKKGAVVPSTMQKCRDYYAQGQFRQHFIGLPFQEYIETATSTSDKLLLQIHALMMKEAANHFNMTDEGPLNPVPPESTHPLNAPVVASTIQTDTVFDVALGTYA